MYMYLLYSLTQWPITIITLLPLPNNLLRPGASNIKQSIRLVLCFEGIVSSAEQSYTKRQKMRVLCCAVMDESDTDNECM